MLIRDYDLSIESLLNKYSQSICTNQLLALISIMQMYRTSRSIYYFIKELVRIVSQKMRAITRIAKAAILQNLCPKSMGKRTNSLCKYHACGPKFAGNQERYGYSYEYIKCIKPKPWLWRPRDFH